MSPVDRRQFLSRLSAAALVLRAHGSAAWAAGPRALAANSPAPAADGDPGPRLLALRLRTAAPLEKMAGFYGQTLGLPVQAAAGEGIHVQAGGTEITFLPTTEPEAQPFYHFAFNIPENKILAARSWQLERTPLFSTPENLRDPSFPNDVRHFRNWNAHSLFFWDPAGNVVEYIARHELRNSAAGSFTSRDILCASEIAFVVDDVPKTASGLEAALSLPQYQSASDVFHATGDERGLLLLFERGRRIGDTLGDRPSPAEVFATHAEIRGAASGTYEFPEGPFEIEIRPEA